MGTVKLFVSYSHKDKTGLDEFLTYINETTCRDIDFWHDDEIALGEKWHPKIGESLRTADIVLLFMSPDFLLSPYIQENELTVALARDKREEARVIPVHYRYINPVNYPPEINALQGLPDPKNPLSEAGTMKDRYFADIQNRLNDVAAKIMTKQNIANAGKRGSDDERTVQARSIERLASTNKIFLSIPNSATGWRFRDAFLKNVESKIRLEKADWNYEVIPGTEEAAGFLDADEKTKGEQLEAWLSECIYHIHLLGDKTDLKSDSFHQQYTLAKDKRSQSLQSQTILWFLDPSIRDEVKTLDEALCRELSETPIVDGRDYNAVLQQIDDLDKDKQKVINTLSAGYSPKKRVFMFYDFQNDLDNDLRIQLRKKIQENPNYVIRDPAEESSDGQKANLADCHGAVIFYGSGCNPIWYKKREDIILSASHIKASAVCVDGKEEAEIEKKINNYVSYNEILPIKGAPDLEPGITKFKMNLQEKP